MPDNQVILCWPSNRKEIAALNKMLGKDEQYSPTVEDTLTTCDGCPRAVWIARSQLELMQSPFVGVARKLCVFCAGEVQRLLKPKMSVNNIAIGADSARRRTV